MTGHRMLVVTIASGAIIATAGSRVGALSAGQARAGQAPARAIDRPGAIRPGRFIVEPPTLICLGFEWEITGDDNRNAAVQVRYRASGVERWSDALPLLRMGGEQVRGAFRGFGRDEDIPPPPDYVVPDKFAGSILDLQPDTEYEIQLSMSDADGVIGDRVQHARVRTRREPKPATGGRVRHVYPVNWKGAKERPAYTGLMDAYYGPGLGDWNVVRERTVGPGDILLVHAGLYKADRFDYVNTQGIPFDGAYVLTAKGTADRPIVIQAAGDGEVIFDGAGAFRLFDVMASSYHLFVGLTIRNTDVAFWAGLKNVLGATALSVVRCRLEDVGIGVTTEFAGSKDFYIADNVILGRLDRYRLMGWNQRATGAYGGHDLNAYYGVKVYGSGHVVAHNAIAFFHDGIDISTYGPPTPGEEAVAIDFYENDIYASGDDIIETDGGVHNIRVLRNRGFNAVASGLSAQPAYGGPIYFIRNVTYNTGSAFKFITSAGTIVYHNTCIADARVVSPISNNHFRNNLFLGNAQSQAPIAAFPNATSYSSYDYDGYRVNDGGVRQFVWESPAQGRLRDYTIDVGNLRSFATLSEFVRATGQEAHGIAVDYSIFERAQPPRHSGQAAPGVLYPVADVDLRLRPQSNAVDAGVPLSNINDDFVGRAPDLGAYEVGQPLPKYGPRSEVPHPFYQ